MTGLGAITPIGLTAADLWANLNAGVSGVGPITSFDPAPLPGSPAPGSYPVRRCLRAVVNEEWLHRLYAERDLVVLEQRR